MKTETDYGQALARIETYLSKGSRNLTEMDLGELQGLSVLVEQYEDLHYPMPIETA